MAQLNFPSMFDTRHAMDRQMQDDAHKAAVAGGGGKRYGMYYNSSLLGDQDIARKRNLLGMFGLGGDPRMQQQNALDDIMARFPNPQTPDDFVEISNALSGVGLHSYAEAAMDMANKVRTSMPERKTIKGADGYNYYADTGERVLPGVVAKEEEPKMHEAADGFWYYASGPNKGKRVFPEIKKPEEERKKSQAADGHWYFDDTKERVFPDVIKPETRTKTQAADGYWYWDDDGTRVFPEIIKPEQHEMQQGADGFLYYTSGPQLGQRVLPNVQVAAKDKSMHKAADGFYYFDDTQERVFPGVVKPTEQGQVTEGADGFKYWAGGADAGKRVFPNVIKPAEQPKTSKGADGYLYYQGGDNHAKRVYPDVMIPKDAANSFEQAALQTLEDDPDFLALSGPEQIEKYAENYRIFHPDNADSANEASLKNIRDDFIVKAQAKLKAAGDENWEEGGITAGDFDFHEFKTNAQKEIQAGNTDLTSVLAQYKIWDDRSTPILKDMDALSNLQYQIQIAKDEDNGQAWQAAQRGFVALMKDSNLSLAEVETVKNAGNLVRKAFNKISEWSTGVPTVEHIEETLAIMSHMEKIIVNRYNDKHTKFNESMSIAGSTPEILKAISGDKMEIVITSLNASLADVQAEIQKKIGAAQAAGQ